MVLGGAVPQAVHHFSPSPPGLSAPPVPAVPVQRNNIQVRVPPPLAVGCPLISLGSETKRNESENERSEIAKKKVSFALKQNGILWMRNEIIQSEKYRKYCTENTENQQTFFTERT